MGGRGENSTVRGQIPDDSPVHSGSMDQASAGIWTAQADSQTGQPKSDRLLGRISQRGDEGVGKGGDVARLATGDQLSVAHYFAVLPMCACVLKIRAQ